MPLLVSNSCPAGWLQEVALKALADSEALVAAPAPRMLSFLARARLPLLTCTTNYVPTQQVTYSPAPAAIAAVPACAGCCRWASRRAAMGTPRPACPAQTSTARPALHLLQGFDLGLGQGPAYDHEITTPRARDMVVIRPAQAPYPPGLFAQLCITPVQAARLRGDPLLGKLLPQASFVGGSGGRGQ